MHGIKGSGLKRYPAKLATVLIPSVDATPLEETIITGTSPSITDFNTQNSGGAADSWTMAPVPPGLTFNVNGTISGVVTAAGTYVITITATNAPGSNSDSYTLTVT